jgi:transcriptional regulator with XRE-family HTH domain
MDCTEKRFELFKIIIIFVMLWLFVLIMEIFSKDIAPSVFISSGEFAPIQIIKATEGAPLFLAMKAEVFVDIKGYEGSYQISNYGRVKSLSKSWRINKTFVASRKERIRKLSIDKFGYYKVNLWDKGKNKRFLVSRLVAQAFVPNPLNLPQVNHKDGKKLNNYFENLEWVTGSENIQHAFDNGLINVSKGEDHCYAKLQERDIYNIYGLLKLGYTQRQVAREMGISSGGIESIVIGKTWKHVGLDFSIFHRITTSKYKCVYWCPRQKKWASRTRIKGKDYFFGYFKEEVDASNAYQKFISEYNYNV